MSKWSECDDPDAHDEDPWDTALSREEWLEHLSSLHQERESEWLDWIDVKAKEDYL